MEETPHPAPPEIRNTSTATPVMDVVAPPPATAAEAKPALPKASQHPVPQPKNKPAKAPAKAGVTTAIIATVIIVLGLAILAVYAYLKQTK